MTDEPRGDLWKGPRDGGKLNLRKKGGRKYPFIIARANRENLNEVPEEG